MYVQMNKTGQGRIQGSVSHGLKLAPSHRQLSVFGNLKVHTSVAVRSAVAVAVTAAVAAVAVV